MHVFYSTIIVLYDIFLLMVIAEPVPFKFVKEVIKNYQLPKCYCSVRLENFLMQIRNKFVLLYLNVLQSYKENFTSVLNIKFEHVLKEKI